MGKVIVAVDSPIMKRIYAKATPRWIGPEHDVDVVYDWEGAFAAATAAMGQDGLALIIADEESGHCPGLGLVEQLREADYQGPAVLVSATHYEEGSIENTTTILKAVGLDELGAAVHAALYETGV